MDKIKNFIIEHLHWMILSATAILISIFLITGQVSENGYITFNGKDAQISEGTIKYIEEANDAIYRIMNEDKPSEDDDTYEIEEGEGQGAYTTLDQVKARRKPDGDNDGGRGWQCSKYTAYLATGKKDYSSKNPDYGPVHGKNLVKWLVDNYGWKYTDNPVEGAIGSGGFNTTYGHTAMFLYWTGNNTAMVNDANYVPLTVSTHNMNVAGWVWAVPGDYNPEPTPTPTPTPEPTPEPTPIPVSDCKVWYVKRGDTMSDIMKACKGFVDWSQMNSYADKWISQKLNIGKSVYYGWTHGTGYGLFAGDTIKFSE